MDFMQISFFFFLCVELLEFVHLKFTWKTYKKKEENHHHLHKYKIHDDNYSSLDFCFKVCCVRTNTRSCVFMQRSEKIHFDIHSHMHAWRWCWNDGKAEKRKNNERENRKWCKIGSGLSSSFTFFYILFWGLWRYIQCGSIHVSYTTRRRKKICENAGAERIHNFRVHVKSVKEVRG